jgi:hypothetical protein
MKMKIDTNKKIKMHTRGESAGRSFILSTNYCRVLGISLHLNALSSPSTTLDKGRKNQYDGMHMHGAWCMVHGTVHFIDHPR